MSLWQQPFPFQEKSKSSKNKAHPSGVPFIFVKAPVLSRGLLIAIFKEVKQAWHSRTVSYAGAAPTLRIGTLEGTMTAQLGDYIIRGINGEFYPCKPDIFEKTYEEV